MSYKRPKNNDKITSDSIVMENSGMTLKDTLNPLRSFRGLANLEEFIKKTAIGSLTGTIRFRDDYNIFGNGSNCWHIGNYIYQNPYGGTNDVGGWFICGTNNGRAYIIKIDGNINTSYSYTTTQLM